MPFGRQDPQHDGFVAVDTRYDCQQCISAHAARVNTQHVETGGTGIVFPPLDAENVAAWELYQQVEDQQIVGMEVIALNHAVLFSVLDLYGLTEPNERRLMYQKVVSIDRAAQAHRALQRERDKSQAALAKSQGAMDRG